MSKVLSPFPYYGGKAKMCNVICSMLNYEASIYIEPYGGGCRTLLNKKRHQQEIYNDFGHGLTTFMSVMASREQTEALIQKLLENPPSIELFNRLVIERMAIEDRLNTSTNEELAVLSMECFRKYNHSLFKRIRVAVKQEQYQEIIELIDNILCNKMYQLDALEWLRYEHYRKLYKEYWDLVKETYQVVYDNAGKDYETKWNELVDMTVSSSNAVEKLYRRGKERYARECALNAIHSYTSDVLTSNEKGISVSDIEIAFNIFQLYYCSRDGMGIAWSSEKNQNIQRYYKAVRNLKKVSERMENVVVTQCDAIDLVRWYRTNEDAMLYLDPSYLKVDDEKQNLGKVYRMSYEYEEHEKLLAELLKSDTRAKILISNYDVELYNRNLSEWKKTYYRTYTGVGSKKSNRRVEVLWQNY
mgnify:FL=1